jgi:hypothetical protein
MSIIIGYTQQTGGSENYTVPFELFTGEDLPGTYVEESSFDFSQSGSAIRGGPARGPRRIWAITSVLTAARAKDLDNLYKAWAIDSGKGLTAVVALDDSSFGDEVQQVDTVVSTAPTFSKFGPRHYLCSIGLTEVGVRLPIAGLEWVTTVSNPCDPEPWTISQDSLNIRYDVADSENCGGTCSSVQSGTATATITIGLSDVLMDLDFAGIGELQDSDFERITFSLNSTQVASARSVGLGSGCDNFGPVTKTYTQPSPYLLPAGSVHTLLINFTTGDALYHVDCFYEVQLNFTPVA